MNNIYIYCIILIYNDNVIIYIYIHTYIYIIAILESRTTPLGWPKAFFTISWCVYPADSMDFNVVNRPFESWSSTASPCWAAKSTPRRHGPWSKRCTSAGARRSWNAFSTLAPHGERSQCRIAWFMICVMNDDMYNMGMDQYLLIPFLVGWTSIYQLFWCSPGVQGFDTLPYV